jgi:hypothetical protein
MENKRIWYDKPTDEGIKEYKSIRKNFLVVSFIIIIYQLGEVDIEKLSLLGTSIEFKNPIIVPYVMYTIFCHHFIRYIQHSMKVGRQIYRQDLSSYLDQKMDHEIETQYYNRLSDFRKQNDGIFDHPDLPVYSEFEFMTRAFIAVKLDNQGTITQETIDLDLPHMRRLAMIYKLKFWILYPDRLDFILPYIIAALAIASYWICF